jgi:uncharacterized protein (DUF1800 family)
MPRPKSAEGGVSRHFVFLTRTASNLGGKPLLRRRISALQFIAPQLCNLPPPSFRLLNRARGKVSYTSPQQIQETTMKSFASCFAILFTVSTLVSPIFAADTAPLSEREKIIHTLNRLGFGPRPGDIERVEKMGLNNYIRQQLYPEKINDSALEKKLEVFDTLKATPEELAGDFYAEQRRALEMQQQRQQQQQGGAQMQPQPPMDAKKRDEMAKEQRRRISLRCIAELQSAKTIRAIESERQFYEVMVDFWSNHFNIDMRKGPCRVLKVVDDRDVIRPHVFGKFRDLLGASAKSPAMLFYLDNVQNSVAREIGPMEMQLRQRMMENATGQKPDENNPPKPKREGGINENYARELMELHTLGVDGGYTQEDVVEVARCFTGWGIQPQQGKFFFAPRRHDNGPKKVLGHNIPANGGIKDGEMVLDILARHPSTAKHISYKLCQRLVSDEPPAQLVERVAKVFLSTDGDLRKVYEAIVTSPEFFSREAYRSKIKSPFEFAVSTVRAMGGRIDVNDPAGMQQLRSVMEGAAAIGFGAERASRAPVKSLNWHIYEMGQPLFGCAAPTGYPEDSSKWVSTGALISRLNFALAMTGGQVANLQVDRAALMQGVDLNNSDAVLNRLTDIFLHGNLTEATRRTLEKQMDGEAINPAKAAALIIGSPEFQRR